MGTLDVFVAAVGFGVMGVSVIYLLNRLGDLEKQIKKVGELRNKLEGSDSLYLMIMGRIDRLKVAGDEVKKSLVSTDILVQKMHGFLYGPNGFESIVESIKATKNHKLQAINDCVSRLEKLRASHEEVASKASSNGARIENHRLELDHFQVELKTFRNALEQIVSDNEASALVTQAFLDYFKLEIVTDPSKVSLRKKK